MLSLIFFPYGGSDRCRREGGNSIGLGAASREWSKTKSVAPIHGGKWDFPSPRGKNRALGTNPDALGRRIVTTAVETPGVPPQILWELGLPGASGCLVPNQHFEPLELKTPELPLKWFRGRRSWGRVKGPASSSGFSSQQDESRDVRSGTGKHLYIYIYMCI